MGITAFFDLAEQPLLYTFEKRRAVFEKKEVFRLKVGPGYEINPDGIPGGIGESYLSVPIAMLDFRIIELPFSDMKKVRDVLPFELDNLLLGGAGDIIFDVRMLEEVDGTYKFLIAFMRKDVLRKLLEGFRRRGLDPKAVTSIDLIAAFDSFISEDAIKTAFIDGHHHSARTEDRISIACNEMTHPSLDLRRGEFAWSGDSEKAKKALRRTAALAVVLLLLFLSDMGLNIVAMKRESAAVRDEIRKTYVSLFPKDRKITSEIYQMKAHLKELKDKEAFFSGVSPLKILNCLANYQTTGRGTGVAFNEITMQQSHIVMKGECRSLGDVQMLKNTLSGLFSDVVISDTKPLSEGKTAFTIGAREKRI